MKPGTNTNNSFVFPRRIALYVAACLWVTACTPQAELYITPLPPDKTPSASSALVRVAHYVDSTTADAEGIIASTALYVLEHQKIPYFDYVIISGAEIKQGSINAYVSFSEPLLRILHNWKQTIKPLRDQGIKVLIGIAGGKDGVSFGSLIDSEQNEFAKNCAEACKFYGVDGVEFYDINGAAPGGRTPYPALDSTYWDGESDVIIGPQNDLLCSDSWKKGAEHFADMLSYLIEALGAQSSFQGDLDPNQKEITPILVREVGFGKQLPSAVPRYAFATTLSCLTYGINDDGRVFGAEDESHSYMDFVGNRSYAPVKFDLGTISSSALEEYSKHLGRSNYGLDGEKEGDCQYGLVYYVNIQPYSSVQTEQFSITSREVFGEGVTYKNRIMSN